MLRLHYWLLIAANQCSNNATCEDDVFGYRCKCSAGWEGSLCDVEINECVDNPCKNGATCIDLFNDFRWVTRSYSNQANLFVVQQVCYC